MRIYRKIYKIILLILLCSFCLVGCGGLPGLPGLSPVEGSGSDSNGSSSNNNQGSGGSSSNNQSSNNNEREDTGERRPVKAPSSVLVPSTGDDFIELGGATLDFSNANRGYVMVNYIGNAERLQVHVTQPEAPQLYRYDVWSGTGWQVIPLSRGSGSYRIEILEHVEGMFFSNLISHTLEVNISDQFLPFLYPNQHVNFNSRTQAVIKAAEIVADAMDDLHAVELIYQFVINTLIYDEAFANAVIAGDVRFYVPDLDEVLKRGRGVCFDYASLMTAMLRAQHIPTRFITGFIPSGEMHAWVMIFTKETGWVGVAEFRGRQWTLVDPTFSAAAIGGNQGELASFIGDGRNYTEMFIR